MRLEVHELIGCISCGAILHYATVANQEGEGDVIICPVCKKPLRS